MHPVMTAARLKTIACLAIPVLAAGEFLVDLLTPLAAKEMGGSLNIHCEGPGQGAAFTLELPCPAPGGST